MVPRPGNVWFRGTSDVVGRRAVIRWPNDWFPQVRTFGKRAGSSQDDPQRTLRGPLGETGSLRPYSIDRN